MGLVSTGPCGAKFSENRTKIDAFLSRRCSSNIICKISVTTLTTQSNRLLYPSFLHSFRLGVKKLILEETHSPFPPPPRLLSTNCFTFGFQSIHGKEDRGSLTGHQLPKHPFIKHCGHNVERPKLLQGGGVSSGSIVYHAWFWVVNRLSFI